MITPVGERERIDGARLRAAAGLAVDPAWLPPRGRRSVVIATTVGAPVGPALDAALAATKDALRAGRALRVATAQSRTVAIGLVLAPTILVPVLSGLTGVDALAFYRSPPGAAVLLVAGALMVVGAAVAAALVRRATRVPHRAGRSWTLGVLVGAVIGAGIHPAVGLAAGVALGSRRRPDSGVRPGIDEVADLVAVGLDGGASAAEALRLAAGDLPDFAAELRRAGLALELGADPELPADLTRIVDVMRSGARLGAATAPSLRELASDMRADALADALAAAERLPAQLTFPTVLCLLPASLLLLGAPLVADGLAAVGT